MEMILSQGFDSNGYARGMPFAWSHGINVTDYPDSTPPSGWMSRDGYNYADSGDFCYIGFLGGSASLSQTVNASGPDYHLWLEHFFAWALETDITINAALDEALQAWFDGHDFDQTPLCNNFIASWPMYLYENNENYTGWKWKELFGEELRIGQLKVYGNGDLKLHQPLLSLSARDNYDNQLWAYLLRR